jgi:hypothetical protein
MSERFSGSRRLCEKWTAYVLTIAPQCALTTMDNGCLANLIVSTLF